MNDILALPASELVRRISAREISAEAVVRAYTERILANDTRIHAWQFFDPTLALAQARACDAGSASGALHGLPIGVKDLMDTADMPSTYGSPIYAGHRPRTDAAVVALSRAEGAIVMGKTVTTEFATFTPGPTCNPRAPIDHPHTPGGSSSGSAAAVAAGMVPLAFGSQTAGSIVRPAAYCGIVGYKPTHGTLPLAGIKALSPSLDTVGVLARSVDDAAFFVGVLARLPLHAFAHGRLRIGICQTPHWERAGTDSRAALARTARLLEQAGAVLTDLVLPEACTGLTAAQIDIMGHEARAAFAPELATDATGLSAAFAALLKSGSAVDGQRFFAAQQLAATARLAVDALFNQVDIVLAPSTEGEAPAGIAATGDPIFNRLWTLLGNPCVHVPTGLGTTGMPIGVTLIGPRWGDAQTIAAARELERQLS
ncbi:amidase [Actimicrobium sp. CCI2.3]|uniref:amidase n=1 Tax=Actimicrobium sp. CCI2.3 TaxID=3048616 RepID=UPI002AB57743|nr:amidase [Actimicrobium sp. CCI2.3]MDY7575582.1 amidase [Actimicrobium sp. CCI2.3]MEB0022846.1 amidase [Actimicrobium sp. CCI2.3]